MAERGGRGRRGAVPTGRVWLTLAGLGVALGCAPSSDDRGGGGVVIDPDLPMETSALPPVNEVGVAAAKFCNFVPADVNGPLALTLELGTTPVSFMASSGQCSPIAGQPCRPIPAGNLPVRLLHGASAIRVGVLSVPTGGQALVAVEIDPSTLQLRLSGRPLPPELACP